MTPPATEETTKPGHWGLMWYGGGTGVGEVVGRGAGSVRRALEGDDTGAPPSPDGVMHLGESEWQDLDAAVRTARSLGAQHVLLVGESAGGSIVGRFLAYSPLAPLTTAVVFDSPLVSVPDTARFTIEGQWHLPAPVTWIGRWIYRMRTGDDPDRVDMLTHPPAVRPATLMLVGGADQEDPVSSMQALAAAGPGLGWPIQYELFPDAGHNRSWNDDPARYDRLVSTFVDRAVPVAR